MKVALVWPYGFDGKYVLPISLAYLKSNVDNARHKVKVIDCAFLGIKSSSGEFRRILRRFNPDVVGVSSWSITYEEAAEVLRTAKEIKRKTITVMGGVHSTTYCDGVMRNGFIDFVLRGEAELSFPRFLEEAVKKKPDWSKVGGLVYRSKDAVKKNEIILSEDLDVIRLPDYDAINLDGYIRSGYRFNTPHKMNAPVWVTRGCPYRCAFCAATLLNGPVVRAHSIEYMIKWVKHLYRKGIRHISIIDDNFTYDVDYAKRFCKAMIRLNLEGLHFGTPNGIRAQRSDPELFRLMKEAGWEYVVVAPESGSLKTLKRMRKNIRPDTFPPVVAQIRKAGLKAHGFFIVGYPGETVDDIQATVRLLRMCRLNFFFLNNFQPLPGTPVYEELIKNGELMEGQLPKDYSSGERAYVPAKLKGYNFPSLILKEYLRLLLSDPMNIPYVIEMVGLRMMFTKVASNLKNMLHA